MAVDLRRRDSRSIKEEDEISSWRDLLVGVAALVSMAAVYQLLGYVIVTTLFIAGVATYFAHDKLFRNLVVGVVVSGSTYILFSHYFGIRLPVGVILSPLGLD